MDIKENEILPCQSKLTKTEQTKFHRTICGRMPSIFCVCGCWYTTCLCEKHNSLNGHYQCLGLTRNGAIRAWNRKQKGVDINKEFADAISKALSKEYNQ